MRTTRPPKPLRERLTQALLKKLYERKLTNAEAAEQLGVSETYLSRTVAAIQEKVPGKSMVARAAASKLFKARRQTRETLAKQVKTGSLTLAKAAERASCSERTMQRFVARYVEPKPKKTKKPAGRSARA